MNRQNWTTKQLIHFSNSIASALGGGFSGAADHPRDTWNTEKLVHMSRSLARAYGSLVD